GQESIGRRRGRIAGTGRFRGGPGRIARGRRGRRAGRQQGQRQQGRNHRAAGHQLAVAAAGLDKVSEALEPPPSPLSARLRFLSPSFLKSVSYQPPPARRNEGAVTWRRTWPGAPQEGQVSGSASDSFCRRSKA